MENILVEIGYQDFRFESINEAVDFARIANRTIDRSRDRDIKLTVTFERDAEEGEDEV